MTEKTLPGDNSDIYLQRAAALYADHQDRVYRRTDKLFAGLMLFQWLVAIAAAFWLSPRTWAGASSRPHIHIWAALFLGGLITLWPVFLAFVRPGRAITRHSIAAGQLLTSALLIHLTGGRIETHFHVFGSLAFLAFYRDPWVVITGTLVTALDHILRGFLWPQSVYGIQTVEAWRWLEHAGWVVFEDIFLVFSTITSSRGLHAICERDARLEQTNSDLERQVESRTEKILYQATHDALSGLPNRLYFHERIEQALAHARSEGRGIAVMFVDLDNFKLINDSQGHEQGDHLLVEVAKRLQESVPPDAVVARMGGDEFTILLETDATEEMVIEVAEKIVARLHNPVRLETRDVFITSSIGIALSRQETEQMEDLIRDADTAMYQAKLNGKAGYVIFDRSMNDRIVERLEIEIGLRHALEYGELRVFYQPIQNLATGRIQGAEALVRWQHPKLGIVSPAKFIPIAEETGLILPIGEWVLQEACSQAMRWQNGREAGNPFIISVNLSGRQLRQEGLCQTVDRILKETGLPPACLKLEITETVMMENIDAAIERLKELKALGVLLAVDDFGTGYSSLSYLQRLPVDTVKIDRSFINVMGSEAQPTAIVEAIINLCRVLNLDVTGEGIESAAQLQQLQSLGCDLGQGYLFAKPLMHDAFDSLLTSNDAAKLNAEPKPTSSLADFSVERLPKAA